MLVNEVSNLNLTWVYHGGSWPLPPRDALAMFGFDVDRLWDDLKVCARFSEFLSQLFKLDLTTPQKGLKTNSSNLPLGSSCLCDGVLCFCSNNFDYYHALPPSVAEFCGCYKITALMNVYCFFSHLGKGFPLS